MSAPHAVVSPVASFSGCSAWRLRARAVYALTKPRLAAMSVLTTMAAYVTSRPDARDALATVLGTTLAACGALSFNQWWERRTDAVMERTRGRPLPAGSLSGSEALGWSLLFSCGGIVVLGALVNATAAAIAAAVIVLYGLVYTPLKRRTRWAREVGSISGALPALLGNAAGGDVWSRPGLTLTAVLLLWQMPHFFAIGWRHRADYRAAGFPLLPAVDATGARTAAWSLGYTLALAVVSLVPWAFGWVGSVYGFPTLVANVWFVRGAWVFVSSVDRERAGRRLFVASLVYLPAVMGALLVERLFML